MRVVQFLFGLVLIVVTVAVEASILVALSWLVLSLVRLVPLVGRNHRHARWEARD